MKSSIIATFDVAPVELPGLRGLFGRLTTYSIPPRSTGIDRDEGLIFVCFQQDLERGFATVQRRLSGQALDKYTLPFGGGYYFVLAGADRSGGEYLGESLFGAAV